MIIKRTYIQKYLPSNNHGFTLIELLLVISISMIFSAGAYSLYSSLNHENKFFIMMKELITNNRTILKMMEFDLKMAGYMDQDSINGQLTDPIKIMDSGNICCDQIEIKYDLNKATRLKIKYETGVSGNNISLFKTKLIKNGINWSDSNNLGGYSKQIVSQNIEDLQFEIIVGEVKDSAFLNPCVGTGCEISIIEIYLLSKSSYPILQISKQFSKSNHYPGNYFFSTNDKFLRKDSFLRMRTRNISPYIYYF